MREFIYFLNKKKKQVEEIKKGLSKPLQEVMLSSDEEDHFVGAGGSLSSQFMMNRSKHVDSQNDEMGDDEDDEDDDDDEDLS